MPEWFQLLAGEGRDRPWVQRPLGLGDIAGGGHEAGEVGIGDLGAVDPEVTDGGGPRRAFLGGATAARPSRNGPPLISTMPDGGRARARGRAIGEADRAACGVDISWRPARRPASASGEQEERRPAR
jgi:hypothetical protein